MAIAYEVLADYENDYSYAGVLAVTASGSGTGGSSSTSVRVVARTATGAGSIYTSVYDDAIDYDPKDHNERFAQEWSKEEYNNDGEKDLDGSIYKVELPFTRMKYERLVDESTSNNTDVMWGYAVNESEEPRLGKPLLTYIIRQTSATSINFVDGTSTENVITTYNIPSNSVSLSSATDKSNLNFKNEINEYDATTDFTDTLFNEYYSTYISDVFNEKNRITKVTAYLPLRILLNYSLADIFIIRGNRYKINSIKTNLNTGKSDIELLNDL